MQKDANIMPNILSLMGHASYSIRAKAVLCVCLQGNIDLEWVTRACSYGFKRSQSASERHKSGATGREARSLMHDIERIGKDIKKQKYISRCLSIFLDSTSVWVSDLLAQMATLLRKVAGRKNAPQSVVKEVEELLGSALCVNHFLQSHVSREKTLTPHVLLSLSAMLYVVDVLKFSGSEKVRDFIFSLLDSVCSCSPKVLFSGVGVLSTRVIPALISCLTSELADTRFNALKAMNDLLPVLLQYCEAEKSESSSSVPATTQPNSKDVSGRVQYVVRKGIIPHLPMLLLDNDPTPQYALRLMNVVVEFDPETYIPYISGTDFVEKLLSIFEPGHPHNSVHTSRLLASLLEHDMSILNMFCDLGKSSLLHFLVVVWFCPMLFSSHLLTLLYIGSVYFVCFFISL